MPFLDADALTTDPDGLAFLRGVLTGKGRPTRAQRAMARVVQERAATVSTDAPDGSPAPRRRRRAPPRQQA